MTEYQAEKIGTSEMGARGVSDGDHTTTEGYKQKKGGRKMVPSTYRKAYYTSSLLVQAKTGKKRLNYMVLKFDTHLVIFAALGPNSNF